MKKQVLVMAALATMMATAVNAQTRIGEFPNYLSDYLPAELTSGGVALLYNSDEDDLFTFVDNNLTVTELQRPERSTYFRYFNLDNPTHYYISGGSALYFTQTLFNNDAEFEYLRYTATNEHTVSNEWETYTAAYITKLEAVTMSGTVLFTLNAPENTIFGDVISYNGEEFDVATSIYAYKWGGAFYLAVREYDTISSNEDWIETYVLYRINQQSQSISRVDGTLPISVFPSVADRDQTITVELGEGNNATEVQVVNAMGQVVKSVSVQPGQREVLLRASDLSSGMHIVGARGRKGQGACKIIVK